MTTPTYSLGVTGVKAHNPYVPKTIQVPDTDFDGNVCATIGGETRCMARGQHLLCKMQDGTLRYHKIDAERSTPGNLVLLPV